MCGGKGHVEASVLPSRVVCRAVGTPRQLRSLVVPRGREVASGRHGPVHQEASKRDIYTSRISVGPAPPVKAIFFFLVCSLSPGCARTECRAIENLPFSGWEVARMTWPGPGACC